MLFLKKLSGAGLCCVGTKSCRNLRIGSACISGEQRWDSGRVFGKKAGTYRSLATISRHTGIPVIPAASYRLPNGKHVLEFHDPIPWKDYETTQESLYRNTLAYNQALEKIILAHPEQWNWMHKRWKLS